MQNIKVAAEILKQIPGLQLHKDLVDVYEKLDSYSEPYIDKRTYIQFDTRPGYIGNKHLVEIIEACKTGSVISFDYKPFKSDEPKSVIVHPYLLKEYNNRWFLIGMTETSIEEKKYEISQFGLERIHGKIKNTGAEYYYHNNFNPDEYLANIIGVFIKAGEEVENIELRFKIDRARYVETNPLHQSQILVNETKTHKTFFYQLIPNPELEALILSYGGDAEVLKPESLRNKIADKLKTARDLYF
jgi:predicted DNA-binding transcriptional regulator YafY